MACESSKQLMWLVVSVAVVISVILLVFRKGLLRLAFGDISADVMKSANDYFLYTIIGYTFGASYQASSAIFRTMGNTGLTMLVSIVINIVNVCGNALLIFKFKMGAAGAAISTMTSHILGASIMMFFVHQKRYQIHIDNFLVYKPDFKIIKRMCAIGIPNGLENGVFQFGKIITQSIVSSLGTAAIAANAVAGSLTVLQYIPGNVINTAMIPVVGRCVGAGEKEQVKKYSRLLIGICYMMLIVIAVVMTVFSKQLVGIYSLSPGASDIAARLVLVHSAIAVFIWPICFVLPTTFRAAGDVRYSMFVSITVMWVCRVGLSIVFVKYIEMGVFASLLS